MLQKLQVLTICKQTSRLYLRWGGKQRGRAEHQTPAAQTYTCHSNAKPQTVKTDNFCDRVQVIATFVIFPIVLSKMKVRN
jgi:hypothetical protein